MVKRLISIGACLTLIGGCVTTSPDFVAADLSVAPNEASFGSIVRVESAMANIGGDTIAGMPPPGMDLLLRPLSGAESDTLVGQWAPASNDELAPGKTVSRIVSVALPEFLPPGLYDFCAVVDPQDRYGDRDYRNNTACAPFSVLHGLEGKPDLIIKKVKVLEVKGRRARLSVTIENAGAAPASDFSVMAFRRAPRWPIPFEDCSDDMASNVCSEIRISEDIAPGGSKTIEGWAALAGGQTGDFSLGWNGPLKQCRSCHHRLDG